MSSKEKILHRKRFQLLKRSLTLIVSRVRVMLPNLSVGSRTIPLVLSLSTYKESKEKCSVLDTSTSQQHQSPRPSTTVDLLKYLSR